jgi:hypothetical protein
MAAMADQDIDCIHGGVDGPMDRSRGTRRREPVHPTFDQELRDATAGNPDSTADTRSTRSSTNCCRPRQASAHAPVIRQDNEPASTETANGTTTDETMWLSVLDG